MKFYKKYNFPSSPHIPATASYFRVSENSMKIDIVEIDRSGEILRMEKKQFLSRGEFNICVLISGLIDVIENINIWQKRRKRRRKQWKSR